MFLIEYMKGRFVNGEDIQSVNVSEAGVNFTLRGQESPSKCVSDKYVDNFLNKLEALNNGYSDIESRYYELKGEDK